MTKLTFIKLVVKNDWDSVDTYLKDKTMEDVIEEMGLNKFNSIEEYKYNECILNFLYQYFEQEEK